MAKLSTIGIVTLVSIILYAITMTVMEILVIVLHHAFVGQFKLTRQGKGISEADLIYHTIFILSLAFQVLLCVDALWRRNSMQLIALVLFNLLSLIYAGLQLYQHMILEEEGTQGADFKPDMFPTSEMAKDYFIERMRRLEYTIIGLVTAFSIYLGALSYRLMKEFGWDIYRTYNADVEKRNAFRTLSILQTLIKLDVFFIGSYAIQLIPSQSIEYQSTVTETVLIFLVGTIMLMMAWYSITKESKYILLCVINILTLSVIYMVFRLISINLPKKGGYDAYEFTRRLLTFFLATTIVLVLATIYYAILCFRNLMHGIYILTVYGLPGQEQQQDHHMPIHQHIPVQQNKFNPNYLGYDGYSGNDYTGHSGNGHSGNGYTGHSGNGYTGNSGHNSYNGYSGHNNYNGYNGHNSYNGYNAPTAPIAPIAPTAPGESNKTSKRASRIAEAQKARLSRRLSID